MRRTVTAALATATLAVAALAIGVSGAVGESGPRCADIAGETHTYRGGGGGQNESPYTLSMALLLAAPACKQITYTVYVIQDSGGPTAIAANRTPEGDLATTPDGNPTFGPVTITDDDPTICVYATTASKGGKVHDRAPDVGCLELTAPASGGGSGFT